jgi:lysophospholipase L1-like esterase
MTPQQRNTRLVLASLAALLALAAAAPAAAKPAKVVSPVKVAVDHPVVGTSANGLDSILVPVHYPIELKGRLAELRVALIGRDGGTIRSWVLHERLNGGRERLPDRRRRFTFVHRVGLSASLSRRLRQGAVVRVVGSGKLDIEEDGKPELRSRDLFTGKPLAGPRPKPVCSSVPYLRVKPGARVSVPLPVCDRAMDWGVMPDASRGSAKVRGGRLIYKAPQQFQGSDRIQLAADALRQYAQVTVGTSSGISVRALGDSVTAGFGYYSNGEEMDILELDGCRPAAKRFNDACSSNSLNPKSEEGPVKYAPDYGLKNKVSWAAQWSREYGITNYRNFAISGSEPKNWAPGGEFNFLTEKIRSENPDYILLTLGANPLLSNTLFGIEEMECARFGNFQECVEEEFKAVELRRYLASVYKNLLQETMSTIFLMQYHLSVPSIALLYSSSQIALMGAMLNREIEVVAAAVNPVRLRVVAPPHFNVGVDLSPVYKSTYTCTEERSGVDGPSVQATLTQDSFKIDPFVEEFCPGPAGGGQTWVIDGDTGIHPSATGYQRMASKLPVPTSPN